MGLHCESDEEERTLVHMGVAQKARIGGGLQTRHNPSLLFGARHVQPLARHGFNPEAQCKHRELENGGKWQFALEHVADDAVMLAAEVTETLGSARQGEADGGLHREQYPLLPKVDRRPQKFGHGVFPASHNGQKKTRSAAASSGQSAAEQRRFLAGSYTHPLESSSLRQEN